MAAIIGMHHLEGVDRVAVQVRGYRQVHRGLGYLDDLDERAAVQRDSFSWRRRAGVYHKSCDIVE